MTGYFISTLRGKLLDLTQAELARALEISPVTLNRWENGDPRYKPADKDTRLLEALNELADALTETERLQLHDLLRVSTVAGVIGKAAIERLLNEPTITRLATTPGLGWLGLVANVGVGSALPFLSMARRQAGKFPEKLEPVERMPQKKRRGDKLTGGSRAAQDSAPPSPSLYSLSIETL
jgi:transcriptional regulator with XRE-family HTH domain